MCARAARLCFLACLALLPWAWMPPFPWLHAHAQWSDAFLAAAAGCWALDRARRRTWPALRPVHLGVALYLAAAVLSALLAAPDPPGALLKVLGMASLAGLAGLAADLGAREGLVPAMARVVAWTSLAAAGAAVLGVALFLAGIPTRLVGGYGDLVPGPYARAQAGLYHPALLGSFCIAAAAVVARADARLPPALRRTVLAALGLAALLTLSREALGFALAAALPRLRRPGWRGPVVAGAALAVLATVGLTAVNLTLDPTRPWAARVDPGPATRVETLTSALATVAAHPLLGAGPGAQTAQSRGRRMDAHLTPLNVAATLGLPALAGFLLIPAALWRDRPRPTDLATWGGLAGLGLTALAIDVEDFRHLWLLLGLAAVPARPAAGPPA
jgi:hypothetical protein